MWEKDIEKTIQSMNIYYHKIHNKKYSLNNTYCIYMSNKTQELSLSLSLSLSLLNLLSINIAFFYRYKFIKI